MKRETEFISFTDQISLKSRLEKGDKQAIDIVFKEMRRMENIITAYEGGISLLHKEFIDMRNKKPEKV